MSSLSWEEYQVEFLTMISELADDFTAGQCERLSFIYKEQFKSSFHDKYASDPLKLLGYLLEERKMFSFHKPEKLATMMGKLGFLDKKEMVESFIDKHKKTLSNILVQKRALPPTPEPIQEEAKCAYVTIDLAPDTTSPRTSTMALPIPGDTPSINWDDQRLDGEYVQPFISLARKSQSMPLLHVQSSPSSDDEESIYEEISTGALKHISHETPPLLIECMALQVSQLRDLVESSNSELLESDPFDCPVLNFSFSLEVNPLDDKCVSAKLYLFADLGMHMKSLHLVDNYYLVELKVCQSKDKRVPKCSSFNLYSTSKVMDRPPVSSSMLLDDAHSETTRGSSDARRSHKRGICIASFPAIISHRNLMDRNLVTKPYLLLTFTLKHLQVM